MATSNVKAGGSTNRFVIGYKPEVAWGVTPAGNYSGLRITGESLGVDEATTSSEEIRPDRQTTDVIRTQYDASGSIDVEWSRDSFDDLIESAMESTWSTKVDVDTLTLGFTASTKTIDAGAGTPFTNVTVGDVIRIGGSVANSGIYTVATKIDASEITVLETVVDETGSGDETVEACRIRNGVTQSTLSIVGGYEDVGVYKVMTGMAVNEMSIEAATGEIITGSFSFTGKDLQFNETAPTIDGAPDTRVFNSLSHFDGLAISGAAVGLVTSLSLSVNNNSDYQRVIGSVAAAGIRDGSLEVTGSIEIYLNDSTFLTKFVNEEEISIRFNLIDNSGYGYVFYLPRVRLSNASTTADGKDNDAMVSFDYTALKDEDLDYTIQISRFTDAV